MDKLSDEMKLYHERIVSLENDLDAQKEVFDAIYRKLRDSDIIILNASGKSNTCASDELIRYVQMGYGVFETGYKFTPGISQFDDNAHVVLLSISGSGNGEVAKAVEKARKYRDTMNITSIGFSAKYDAPLKAQCDLYLVLSGNNKEAENTSNIQEPGNYMGDDFENKSKLTLNYIWRKIASEKGISESDMKAAHNIFG